MRKVVILFTCLANIFYFSSCNTNSNRPTNDANKTDSLLVEDVEPVIDTLSADDILIVKELKYDKYTLEDTYPYKDTVRVFQWDKIKERLALVENMQRKPAMWAVLQNYKNLNGQAPLVKVWNRDEYKRISDTLGVERYQSVPLFLENDTLEAELYGRDGSLVRYLEDVSDFVKVEIAETKKEWLVPKRYIKTIGDTVVFNKAVFVDVTNQNIATLEKTDTCWVVRSMNPATTGKHRPPYGQETPTGLFVVQDKRSTMIFLQDGSLTEHAGFAPYASRFTNGAYIHGVPVNLPRTDIIEFSSTLGTTPRSHMCVRNASSHAKFVYDWAPKYEALVFVLD
ncbi:hypothetical protein M2132_000422 [Dysgonomonas sp. PH5-45]|uniref:L,D-transpeptidase n=1 Tax=unclassified Dysgonomonas TaxID=2630389 RepID=UPI0024736EF6|nr:MULTISPECIES: L,D-transpeptidase [unclassified Dysgonomonas]MDH6354100.1 hypothetical protein [Dysgonomonas sp. PH5-45]MDH6387049.1 hypothetical protein [Dysgonomonas sp. PH5-37]